MAEKEYQSDVVIVGAGIAGIVAALELLEHGVVVTVVDRDSQDNFGGLAKESFGGIFLVNSREQRRLGIRDSVEVALDDWIRTGEIDESEHWPRRWAEEYIQCCSEEVDAWLRRLGVRFFPVVHWVERGQYGPGNSVPRFHMVWGTGSRLVELLVGALQDHPRAHQARLLFEHRVDGIESADGRAAAVYGVDETSGQTFRAAAGAIVVATGGYCGNLEWIRRNWDAELGHPPETLLNGSHRYADGRLHEAVAGAGGRLDNIHRSWLYAAGIRHPSPRRPDHGLSLVPPRSALWMNHRGVRLGPKPLVTGFDTRSLVQRICSEPKGYSWQVMNRRIAVKELAVSGSEFNDGIRDRKVFTFLRTVLRGNAELVDRLLAQCEDVVAAASPEELAARMNELCGNEDVDATVFRDEIERYDDNVRRGAKLVNDEQIRRISHLRQYRGDRVRTCNMQPILDEDAGPLIAIREFILTRKSLGGIRTDLDCRVVSSVGGNMDSVIPGLYAVGEAAGFGGGGIHGKRSLEGTFLATCIFTGRRAGRAIAGR